MNALLYQQSAQGSAKTRDRRTNGASVKIVKKTICGIDLHIPFADTSFYHIPSGAEEDALVTPMPLKTVRSHKIDPKQLITHRFKFDKILDAYDTFSAAAKTNALKVLIEA